MNKTVHDMLCRSLNVAPQGMPHNKIAAAWHALRQDAGLDPLRVGLHGMAAARLQLLLLRLVPCCSPSRNLVVHKRDARPLCLQRPPCKTRLFLLGAQEKTTERLASFAILYSA
jgi:hypothetical protein